MDGPLNSSEAMELLNALLTLQGPLRIRCQYTNWRGERADRHLRLLEVWHGSTNWHPKPSLMVKAIDLENGNLRDFCAGDFDISTLRNA